MFNLKELEQLRDEKEIFEYFKARGIKITHQQINKLKQNYENLEYNADKLTLNQLDKVAGGVLVAISRLKKDGTSIHSLFSTVTNVEYLHNTLNPNNQGASFLENLVGNTTLYPKIEPYLKNTNQIVVIKLDANDKLSTIQVSTCRNLNDLYTQTFQQLFIKLKDINDESAKAQIKSITSTTIEDKPIQIYPETFTPQKPVKEQIISRPPGQSSDASCPWGGLALFLIGTTLFAGSLGYNIYSLIKDSKDKHK